MQVVAFRSEKLFLFCSRFFSSLCELCCCFAQVFFQSLYCLLCCFRQLFVTCVDVTNDCFQSNNSLFGTSWSIFCYFVDQTDHFVICFCDMCFNCFSEFLLSRCSDACQVTAICQCFFCAWLSFCCIHVQSKQLLQTFKCFFVQCCQRSELRFQVSFCSSDKLFW